MTPHDTAPAATLPAVAPIDETVDHVLGPPGAHLILEYGDYECPYSRAAFREIQRVERALDGGVRFAFRHFPLMGLHPRALAAAAAAEAAALQGRFWEMSETLFHRALASRQVRGTPTLFLDGALHQGGYDAKSLLEAVGA